MGTDRNKVKALNSATSQMGPLMSDPDYYTSPEFISSLSESLVSVRPEYDTFAPDDIVWAELLIRYNIQKYDAHYCAPRVGTIGMADILAAIDEAEARAAGLAGEDTPAGAHTERLSSLKKNGSRLYSFLRTAPSFCAVCKRVHDADNIFVTETGGVYRLYCHRASKECDLGFGAAFDSKSIVLGLRDEQHIAIVSKIAKVHKRIELAKSDMVLERMARDDSD